jgi:AraC family transcriptional regulator
MASRYVPVHMGSPRFEVFDTGGFRITDAWFPAGAYLPPHIHERPILSAMLSGSFLTEFRTRTCECTPATVFTEPAGERHANRIQGSGAHVVVIQPDPEASDRLRPASRFWEEIHNLRHGTIADRARQLSHEVRSPDAVSPIAVEALVLEMIALAVRLDEGRRMRGRPPAWLGQARDLVHDRFLEKLRIEDVAQAVAIHPTHLARTFREHFHVPIGTYIRRLRIEWATRQVAETDYPLSGIAARGGFADQSHFTREFRRRTGLTPARYREMRGDRSPVSSTPG